MLKDGFRENANRADNIQKQDRRFITETFENNSILIKFDNMTTSNSTISTVPACIITMRQHMKEKQLNRQKKTPKWWQAWVILYP